MNGLRARLVQVADRLGWPGVLGLGLLAFCAGFYLSTVRPGAQRIAQTRSQIVSLDDLRARAAGEQPPSAREQLSAFYGFFPPPGRTADSLGKIFAMAEQQALALEQGDYRVVKESTGALTHYQLVLPLKGTYPQIRKFVAAVLRQQPNVALDGVQFERRKVGDASVDARIRFVMYLGREP